MTQEEFGRPHAGRGETARREAGTVAQEARGAARDLADGARRAGERARSEAAGIVGTVRDQLAGQAEAQKAGAADRVAAIADHLHGSAEDLRQREGWLADLLDRGARELDDFADELRQRDIKGLVGGIESFAHRHPAVFIGSTVAIGFALTRMLKSGQEPGYAAPSYERRGSGTGYPSGPGADPARSYPGSQRVHPADPAASASVGSPAGSGLAGSTDKGSGI